MLKNILSRLKKNANSDPESNPVTAPYYYQIDAKKCRSCGSKCIKACKAGAISGERGKAHVIDKQKCIKCGACMKWCKHRAVKKWICSMGNTALF